MTIFAGEKKSHHRGLNPGPQHYKCCALPLSYSGFILLLLGLKNEISPENSSFERRKKDALARIRTEVLRFKVSSANRYTTRDAGNQPCTDFCKLIKKTAHAESDFLAAERPFGHFWGGKKDNLTLSGPQDPVKRVQRSDDNISQNCQRLVCRQTQG